MLEPDHPGILRTELPFPEEGARLRLSFISVRRDVKNRLTLTRVHPKDGRNRLGPDDGGRGTVKRVEIDDKYTRRDIVIITRKKCLSMRTLMVSYYTLSRVHSSKNRKILLGNSFFIEL